MSRAPPAAAPTTVATAMDTSATATMVAAGSGGAAVAIGPKINISVIK